MLRLVAIRAANALLVMLAASALIFAFVSLSGDPLAELRDRQPPVPPSVIQAEEVRLGLDKPLPLRYVSWLTGIVQGNFGPSVIETKDIATEITSRVGVTMSLVSVAMVIGVVISIAAGTVAGLNQRRWQDFLITPTAFLLLAMPSFWLAVLLKQGGIAANRATGYQIFYTIGATSAPPPEGFLPALVDFAGHLVLPTLVLMLVHFAVWSRYQRAATLDSLSGDHVRYAVLRGLGKNSVIRRYVMRPALIPIVTIVALDMPSILAGAIITETVFQWRGMGTFLLESVSLRDVNAVLAWLLIAAFAVILFNFLADVLYAVLDPRVRHGD